jgi:hypothetical protein
LWKNLDIRYCPVSGVFLLIAVSALLPSAWSQTNLALHKPAKQSSTYSGMNPASVCVDGARTGIYCHTNLQRNPWWQVDLRSNFTLGEVVVYNRADCGERSRTITALLSSDGQNWNRIYAHKGGNFKVLHIPAKGQTARYVRLQLAATEYLNLQEVEVFGPGRTK